MEFSKYKANVRDHSSKGKAKRSAKRKQDEDEVDPVHIRVEKLISHLERFEVVWEGALARENVAHCDAQSDAILFHLGKWGDCKGVEAAPCYPSRQVNQCVHIVGFAKWEDHETFSFPGEVTLVKRDSFLVTCPSLPGLSGSAVVCDEMGDVLGYVGGSALGGDSSFIGAYAYPIERMTCKIDY
eukprot:TRINITY_DN1244_c0_g2_i6.p1 TRINITY_DN1244_c0_g2~~TRINITY_DN1244_c0_g2_i6.p1  ORF type:complete len:184 (+),score=0.42 TRINITY_DN1244_c0_g2_i6:602-1153(+)